MPHSHSWGGWHWKREEYEQAKQLFEEGSALSRQRGHLVAYTLSFKRGSCVSFVGGL